MSLLIKALDNAEKNKQAEKDKKQAEEQSAGQPLSLSLEEIEPKSSPDLALQLDEPSQPSDSNIETTTVDAFADNGLSLEEEAGLSPPTSSKYAKPKTSNENKAAKETKTVAKKPSVTEAPQPKAPTTSTTLPPVFQALAAAQANEKSAEKTQLETNQKAAAKVFVANQPARTNSSKLALVMLGIAGALMIWLGLQGYGYIKTLLAPDVVVVKPTAPIESIQPPVEVANNAPGGFDPNAAVGSVTPIEVAPDTEPVATIDAETEKANKEKLAQADEKIQALMAEEPVFKESVTKKSASVKAPKNELASEDTTQLRHAPVKLVSKSPTTGVDPTLMSAYQAFNRGEDASAQQQYRQVLQQDVRNVDALLGMAAIAQRQGRNADAAGWYQKVLEIEPRNSLAQSALVATQVNSNAVGAESRIKNMLAQQPDAAHLHAALGNTYAEQKQWPLAQESYFNASRLAPNNADYAFNLAISLDQLGKSNLALQQYQRALDLINQSGATSPDREQLETRIRALQ